MGFPVAEHAPPPASAVRGAPVLVVHSNTAARAAIGRLLEIAGFEVTACATATQALEHLQACPSAAMVVDYMLDDMSGFALVHACHAANVTPAIVMTAARGEISAAVRAVREGVSDFLPGAPDARIVQAVRAALRKVN